MNLPNKLTILRILLVPFVILFMLPLPLPACSAWNGFIAAHGMFIALLIFSLASFTDYLDGSIARSRGLVSNFGKFLDPIADKLLVLSVFTALVQVGRIHALVPILVLFRELMVSGIRLLAAEGQKVIAASQLGKLKTVTQIAAIILIMLELTFSGWALYPALLPILALTGNICLLISVLMTFISGMDYLLKNKKVFSS